MIQSQKNPETILVVDDTRTMRRTLKRILQIDAYTVYEACDAAEMFKMLPDVQPDTILLDAMMPGMSGFEASQICKAHDKWRHIPIIMVTSLSQSEYIHQGLDSGADDFLQKPVKILELRARVRSALRTKRQFDEMQQLIQVRDQMASILVHDMRSPLASIMLNTDIGNHFTEHARVQKALDTIKMQSERLQTLISDMLTAARLEDGHLSLDQSIVQSECLVQAAMQRFSDLAERHQIQLTFESALESAEILADKRLMGRVLDNLLSNALKYSPQNATVIVRLSQLRCEDVSFLCMEVIDEGPGVPANERELIFDRFGVGSVKSARGTQLGLGLPFCRMVMEAHGGTLNVHGNIPTGSNFRCLLPRLT